MARRLWDNEYRTRLERLDAIVARQIARGLRFDCSEKLRDALYAERDTAKLTNALKLLASLANPSEDGVAAGGGVTFTISLPDGDTALSVAVATKRSPRDADLDEPVGFDAFCVTMDVPPSAPAPTSYTPAAVSLVDVTDAELIGD
jgi:hypothetical protein